MVRKQVLASEAGVEEQTQVVVETCRTGCCCSSTRTIGTDERVIVTATTPSSGVVDRIKTPLLGIRHRSC
jgi:hypothetical protein